MFVSGSGSEGAFLWEVAQCMDCVEVIHVHMLDEHGTLLCSLVHSLHSQFFLKKADMETTCI